MQRDNRRPGKTQYSHKAPQPTECTLRDLCAADKQKVARLVKQVVRLGEENERLEALRSDDQFRQESKIHQLQKCNHEVITTNTNLKRRLLQVLTLAKTYQHKVQLLTAALNAANKLQLVGKQRRDCDNPQSLAQPTDAQHTDGQATPPRQRRESPNAAGTPQEQPQEAAVYSTLANMQSHSTSLAPYTSRSTQTYDPSSALSVTLPNEAAAGSLSDFQSPRQLAFPPQPHEPSLPSLYHSSSHHSDDVPIPAVPYLLPPPFMYLAHSGWNPMAGSGVSTVLAPALQLPDDQNNGIHRATHSWASAAAAIQVSPVPALGLPSAVLPPHELWPSPGSALSHPSSSFHSGPGLARGNAADDDEVRSVCGAAAPSSSSSLLTGSSAASSPASTPRGGQGVAGNGALTSALTSALPARQWHLVDAHEVCVEDDAPTHRASVLVQAHTRSAPAPALDQAPSAHSRLAPGPAHHEAAPAQHQPAAADAPRPRSTEGPQNLAPPPARSPPRNNSTMAARHWFGQDLEPGETGLGPVLGPGPNAPGPLQIVSRLAQELSLRVPGGSGAGASSAASVAAQWGDTPQHQAGTEASTGAGMPCATEAMEPSGLHRHRPWPEPGIRQSDLGQAPGAYLQGTCNGGIHGHGKQPGGLAGIVSNVGAGAAGLDAGPRLAPGPSRGYDGAGAGRELWNDERQNYQGCVSEEWPGAAPASWGHEPGGGLRNVSRTELWGAQAAGQVPEGGRESYSAEGGAAGFCDGGKGSVSGGGGVIADHGAAANGSGCHNGEDEMEEAELLDILRQVADEHWAILPEGGGTAAAAAVGQGPPAAVHARSVSQQLRRTALSQQHGQVLPRWLEADLFEENDVLQLINDSDVPCKADSPRSNVASTMMRV